MSSNAILALDTSNYTTSAALCGENGRVLLNVKAPLPVKDGERGLRQSDAVFHHTRNFPKIAEKVRKYISDNGINLIAVGVSDKPRGVDGSYMPCFLSGVAVAEMISAVCGIPLYRTSHQAGHIMAAIYSASVNCGSDMQKTMSEKFLAFHVSGGTTDLLLCEPDENELFKIRQIGGSHDINGGQAVDRSGVMMGLSFPCGPELDNAALEFDGKLMKPKLSVKGTWCNLSGVENKSAQLYSSGGNIPEVAAFTLDFIAKTIEKITENALIEYGEMPVIYAGGVMSSRYIRRILENYGSFADPVFSADNAAGVSLITLEKHRRMNEYNG